MKKITLLLIPAFIYFFSATSCVKDRVSAPAAPDTSLGSRMLIHYWNFNSSDTTQMLMPNTSIGGASITYVAAYYDAVDPGSSFNLRNGDTAGTGLRMRNPFTSVTFNLPTTGYQQPILIFAAERSSNGPSIDNVSYTLDGTTFTAGGLAANTFALDTLWNEYTFDFSSIAGASNNPHFAVQFSSANNNTGTSGNDRYDNVTLDAYKQ
jgi:hypothetical protein